MPLIETRDADETPSRTQTEEFDPARAGGHCVVGKAGCPGISAMFFGDVPCAFCWWLTPAGGHVYYHRECFPETAGDRNVEASHVE